MISISVKPLSANPAAEPLVFVWDEASGEVSGPSAEVVRAWAAEQGVPLHPAPAWHDFSAEPLKSLTDMAAMVGYLHELPPELVDAYPAVEDVLPVAQMLDADGNALGAVDVLF